MEVKCHFCGEKVDKKIAARHNDKNFHPACLETYLQKKDCCDYICSIFNIKTPGPKIYNQLAVFTTQNKYTYNNIKKTLQYWYEIKKGSRKKANEGIGIVPYMYEEAMQYYKDLAIAAERGKEEYKEYLEKQKKQEHFEVKTVSGRPNIIKQYELY